LALYVKMSGRVGKDKKPFGRVAAPSAAGISTEGEEINGFFFGNNVGDGAS